MRFAIAIRDHPAAWNRTPLVHGHVRTREHSDHSGCRQSGFLADAFHSRVRVRRPHEHRPQFSRAANIVHEPTPAGKQTPVFLAFDCPSNQSVRRFRLHRSTPRRWTQPAVWLRLCCGIPYNDTDCPQAIHGSLPQSDSHASREGPPSFLQYYRLRLTTPDTPRFSQSAPLKPVHPSLAGFSFPHQKNGNVTISQSCISPSGVRAVTDCPTHAPFAFSGESNNTYPIPFFNVGDQSPIVM